MNKLLRLTVIIVFIFMLLSGCDKEPNSSINQETTIEKIKATEEVTAEPLTEEDFIVKNDDCHIVWGSSIDDLKVDEKLIYHRPLTETKLYEVYNFENFSLSVGLDNEIFSITLFTSKFETARGIKVGDSVTKLFEAYGVIEKDDEYDWYRYHGPNHKWILFEVDKNKIITRINMEII